MTPRRIIFWFVALPITIGVWAKTLTLPQPDPAPKKFQARLPPQGPPPRFQAKPPPPSTYACPIAAQCSPVAGSLGRAY